jgi:hypothetical protein
MRQWRSFNEKYEVSDDGMVRLSQSSSAGPAGRMLLPGWSGGSAIYFMSEARNKPVRQLTMTHVVLATWGAPIKSWTVERYLAARDEVFAHNRNINPDIVARAKSSGAVECFRPKVEKTEIDFSTMTTNCPEAASWDDPRMDPMTCRIEHSGVWFDAAPVAQEVAA